METITNIAVIGATGMLGEPVTRALIEAGYTVTILARNPGSAQARFPKASVVAADLRDLLSLERALQGQHAIYLNLSVKPSEKPEDFHTEVEGLAHLLAAAKTCRVRRIGYLSSLVMNYQNKHGFHWWVFDVKQQAVEQIKQSGIPYLIFYPSSFMENFNGVQRRGNKLSLAGKSHHKMYYIAGADYGRQVARAFALPGNGSREFTIQGPQGFTADEAAQEFVRNYKKEKLSVSKAPLGLLKFIGKFNRQMHYASHILEALNNYPEKFAAEKTWHELGKPEISLAQFAASS